MRELTDEERAALAAGAARLLQQQEQAARHTGFDGPPDGFIRELRAARPC